MIIIDFDDTLFDTTAFKTALQDAAIAVGVGETDYHETYHEARVGKDKQWAYSCVHHAELLAGRGYVYDEVYEALSNVLASDFTKLVLPGAYELLKKFKADGHEIKLLSLGDPVFQKQKVTKAKIDTYCDDCTYVNMSKRNAVKEFIINYKEDRQIIFINDKPEETKEIADAFPDITCILRKRPGIDDKEYEQTKLPFYEKLTDIYAYVEKL